MNEILLVAVIGLLILGPKQLPQVARSVGKMMAQFKRATNDLRDMLHDEVAAQEGLQELKDTGETWQKELKQIQHTAEGYLEEGRAMAENHLPSALADFPALEEEISPPPIAAPTTAEREAEGVETPEFLGAAPLEETEEKEPSEASQTPSPAPSFSASATDPSEGMAPEKPTHPAAAPDPAEITDEKPDKTGENA